MSTRAVQYYRGRAPWFFLLPYLAVAVCFVGYPLLRSGVLAFYQTNGPASRVFVGLDNFRFLLTDATFYRALANTSVFALCSVFVQLPLSLGLALLVTSIRGPWRSVFRLVLFSPNLVGQIFVGILFGVLLTPRYGLINRFLQAFIGWGLEAQWLGDPALVMPAIVLTALWLYVGFNMIYFLAALQSVDRSQQEAARIDGATAWQVLWHVTLPSMRHVLVFVVITSIIGSFQLFELPLALLPNTAGRGPDNAGLTVVGYLYDVGFNSGDLGLGSAVGWVVALLILLFSTLQLRLTGAEEV
ncbi:MAG TPA: sugar ABC transporter permease [Polyangiaceae bacterium]|nr:sugar ABC transporter permease [Polyangiaceae bacterium]